MTVSTCPVEPHSSRREPGIGRAIALALAEHGADVAINHTSAFDAEVGFPNAASELVAEAKSMVSKPSRSRATSQWTALYSMRSTGRSRPWVASISS